MLNRMFGNHAKSGLSRFRSSRKRRVAKTSRRLLLENVESRVLLAVDLSLSISDGDITSSPGETIAYTLSYANRGNSTATGVVMNARLPLGTTFHAESSDAGWSCNEARRPNCSLELGDLTSGASGEASFGVTVDSDVSPRLPSVNFNARISDDGEAGRDANRRNNFDSERTRIVQQLPDLTINFHDSRATVEPGGTIVYTAEYANEGVVAARGASLSIRLPENTSFNSDASSAGWECVDGECNLLVGDVAAGEAGNATFAVDVASSLSTDIRRIRASATIDDDGSGPADSNSRNNSDGAVTPVIHALPDLALNIDDGDAGVAPGGSIVYTLEYSNQGTADATGSTIQIRIPEHTTFDASASTEGWACIDGVCTLDIGAVGTGATGTAVFATNLDADVSTNLRRISTRAQITDDGLHGRDANPLNNRARESIVVRHALPDLAVELTDGVATVTPNDAVTYTLNYANNGTVNATGVSLHFLLPRHATLDETANDGWSCDGRSCTFEVGSLDAGATGSITVAVTVNSDARRLLIALAQIADDRENGSDPDRWNNFDFAVAEIEPLDAG